MHPGAWILWSLGAALVTMMTTNPFYLLPILASAWAVHAAHRNSGPHARSFRIFLMFGVITIATRTLLVFLFPASVSAEVVANAFLEGLRLAVLLTVFGAFNSVADPFGVLRLAPRRFHEPALAAALALSIAPRTIASVTRVREAQRMRGIHVGGLRALPALAVPVLETGIEEAVILAESMDARGHGRGRRSRYRPVAWDRASVITATAGPAAAVIFLVAAGRGVALSVSTFPVTWPEAAPALVFGTCLLAVPAFLRASADD
jgi:energy-coupling factor transport system permease protein